MMEIVLGKQIDQWDQHLMAIPVCPLSPLSYSNTAAETILACAKYRQPLYINSCILAGVTGPLSLLGTATLMNTEILAGLVLAQLTGTGTPVVYVPGSSVADMQTGAYISGSPDSNLIVMAGLQMALNKYHLPTRVMGGLSDAKAVDYQAGVETMQNMMVNIMSGAHFLNNSLGNMDSQMTTSLEKFVLDVESIERVLRIKQGLEGNDLDMAVDIIQKEAHHGNYLLNPNTHKYFKERWRPKISIWDSYNNWEKTGGFSVVSQAHKYVNNLLDQTMEPIIDKKTDQFLNDFIKKI